MYFSPSKPSLNYFWIWFRLTFVATPRRLVNLYQNAKSFDKKHHKNSFCLKSFETFILTEPHIVVAHKN
jgi:hypothetical protein